MPHLLEPIPVHIPEICTKQCFGDYIKFSTEEKKCLIKCFQRNTVLSPHADLRKSLSLIFWLLFIYQLFIKREPTSPLPLPASVSLATIFRIKKVLNKWKYLLKKRNQHYLGREIQPRCDLKCIRGCSDPDISNSTMIIHFFLIFTPQLFFY